MNRDTQRLAAKGLFLGGFQGQESRRSVLARAGTGLGTLALASFLARNGDASDADAGKRQNPLSP